MKQYRHLSKEERFYIDRAVHAGKNQLEIANELDRHPSTISREMRRNMWPSAYLYTCYWAVLFSRQRKQHANSGIPEFRGHLT